MSQNHKVSQRSLLAVMIFSNSFSLIMILKLKLPDILPSEMTPLVQALLAIIEQLFELVEQQKEQINQLKDEIRVLKKQKKTFLNPGKWMKKQRIRLTLMVQMIRAIKRIIGRKNQKQAIYRFTLPKFFAVKGSL